MGLLDRFRRQPRVEEQRAFDPPLYHAGTQRVGIRADGSQPSGAVLLGAVEGTQAIAAGALAARISSLNLEVVERRGRQSGTMVEEVLDDHPLAIALDANPIFSLRQLLSLAGYWLAQSGEAYFLKVTDRLRVTRELWPLAPSRIEPRSGNDLPIATYTFHGDAGEREYDVSEIVRIWRPDPAAIFQGLGNLGPQALAFDAGRFIDETVRSHYERDAIPKVALKALPGASVPTGDNLVRWLRDWRIRFDRRGGTMRGLPAFLPPGFEPHEFGKDTGAFSAAQSNEYRDRLLMANGVPRSILGDVVDANRAAAETNQFVFDQHAVKPWADLISEGFTRQLARDYDPNLTTRFAEFVSEDKTHTLAQEAQDLSTKVRSVNQVREDRGLDPVEWGDEPIGSFGDIPYRPDEEPEPMESDDPAALGIQPDDSGEPEGDDPDEGDPGRGSRAAALAFSTEAAWAVFVMRERKYQAPFERAIRQVLAEQRDAALEALAAEEPRSGGSLVPVDPATSNLGDPRRPASGARTEFDVDALFQVDEWRRLFARIVEPVRRRAFREVAEDTIDALGVQVGFGFDERVENMLARQAAELVTNVTATTRSQLAREITIGVGEGEGTDQIAKRIRSVFRTRRDHARTIARTEVVRATQAAQVTGFDQSGVVARKRWNTSQDDAVRDSHRATDGQVRLVHEAFVLGDGEQSDSPGSGANGATLSARNAINCRCFLTPVFEGE